MSNGTTAIELDDAITSTLKQLKSLREAMRTFDPLLPDSSRSLQSTIERSWDFERELHLLKKVI